MANPKARHILKLKSMPLCILLYVHKYVGRNTSPFPKNEREA